MSDRYVSVSAFARRLDTSRQQVHRWIRDGEISVMRVGRVVRISCADADAFITRHEIRKSRAAR